MSDNSVNVEIEEVLDLVKGISSTLKEISENNSDMKQKLRTLGVTFQDEGFDKVCGMVANAETKLNEACPDLNMVIGGLTAYAEKLLRSIQGL